jgi:hypothetical protein
MATRSKPKTVSLVLRLPSELHKALVKSAAAREPINSLNREIVSRLHDSFETNLDMDKLAELMLNVNTLRFEVSDKTVANALMKSWKAAKAKK